MLDRRYFLRGLAVAPLAVAPLSASLPVKTDYSRISTEKGDPGEIPLAKLWADGKRTAVFMDGHEQKFTVTADAKEGWVKRAILSDEGRPVVSLADNELMYEIARGRVEIRILT